MGCCLGPKGSHEMISTQNAGSNAPTIREEARPLSYKSKGRDWAETCSIGKSQSPINIEERPEDTSAFQIVSTDSSVYKPLALFHTQARVVTCARGNGNFVVKDCITGSFSGVVIGAALPQSFNFKNMHFHSDAEHQINGKIFPLEMHLVHQDAFGSVAVIGVLFEEGSDESRILKAAIQGSSLDLDNELGKEIDDFYFYLGSLTTPPCTEPVNWFIRRQPVKAAHHQLKYFRDMWPDNPEFAGGNGNNREIQPRNGRTVYRFQKKSG